MEVIHPTIMVCYINISGYGMAHALRCVFLQLLANADTSAGCFTVIMSRYYDAAY